MSRRAHRCGGCGRFSAGPFECVETNGDSLSYVTAWSLIGPCCMSTVELERNGLVSPEEKN